MSLSLLEVLAASLLATLGVGCFCGDACDEPELVKAGRYRLESTSATGTTRESRAGVQGGLVYDPDAGTVTVTRVDGGTRTERWRIVDRRVNHEEKNHFYWQADAAPP
jgi:hypothetical protein